MISLEDDPRLSAVRDGLAGIGYTADYIELRYPYTARNGHTQIETADLVAFSDPERHDIGTACVVAQRITDNTPIEAAVQRLASLAAPVAILLLPDSVHVAGVTVQEQAPTVAVTEDISIFLHEQSAWLRREALTKAKTEAVQLTLFRLDPSLLDYAYEVTKTVLVSQFERAVSLARNLLAQQDRLTDTSASDLLRLALKVLAAVILEDKGILRTDARISATELISLARQLLGSYFGADELHRLGNDIAEELRSGIREGVTYRSFANEMLGHFNEYALLQEADRRRLGIYYTPAGVARKLVSRIPFEFLPPDRRTVLDGTCGSGSLLLAAYERLRALLPVNLNSESRHEYLVNRIHGYDVDSFATDVARLGLSFIDMPHKDGWHIERADFLQLGSRRRQPALQPDIVVANPPFKHSRSLQGRQDQLAARVLEIYLNWLRPDGWLGIILPETFVETQACQSVRRRLLNECSVTDLWQVPDDVFPASGVPTIMLIANKKGKSIAARTSARIERVSWRQEARQRFVRSGESSISFSSPTSSWEADTDTYLHASPLPRTVLRPPRARRTLRDVALVKNGIIAGSAATPRSAQAHDSSWKPWLTGGTGFKAYQLAWERQRLRYIHYPDDLQWPRLELERYFARANAKVLVNSSWNPGSVWRIFAVVDDVGYYPAQGAHCIIPTGATRLELLTAILNSRLANAIVNETNRTKWIRETTLQQLPWPDFTSQGTNDIIALVQRITALRRDPATADSDQVLELLDEIDERICSEAGLTDSDVAALDEYFMDVPRPGFGGTNEPDNGVVRESGFEIGLRRVAGIVEDIDGDRETVRLWLRNWPGSEDVEAPIPAAMPGWAMMTGATFTAYVPWTEDDESMLHVGDLQDWRPVDYAYLSDDQLQSAIQDGVTSLYR